MIDISNERVAAIDLSTRRATEAVEQRTEGPWCWWKMDNGDTLVHRGEGSGMHIQGQGDAWHVITSWQADGPEVYPGAYLLSTQETLDGAKVAYMLRVEGGR